MIDDLPKNGLLQKGQYLSLAFFQKQITKNLGEVKTRIRDLVNAQARKKIKKVVILNEQEYYDQYFQAHSLDYQCNLGHGDLQNLRAQNDRNYQIISKQFVADYPLFYGAKWKIWFSGRPSIRTLAMLNHLAYGYFYETNGEGEIVPLLKQKSENLYTFRQELLISWGTAKLIYQNRRERNQFCYVDYIEYNEDQNALWNSNNKAKDPRKIFNLKQLKLDKRIREKNQKIFHMTPHKLRQGLEVSLNVYHNHTYENFKASPHIMQQFIFNLTQYCWAQGNIFQPDAEEMQLIKHMQNNNQEQFLKKSMIDFEKSAKLVPFLEKIPNFAYSLSKQERQVIQLRGNVIIIGRSGTGKTTCALLRLFSLQTLLKVKMVAPKKFTSKDLDIHSPMRNILISASPYLIEELKKNYSDHFENVKYQLEKKEKQSHPQDANNASTGAQINNLQELRLVEDKIRKMNLKMKSLHSLTPADFPGFFTIKNFLIMIDGVYNENFFLRNKEKQLYLGDNVNQLKMNTMANDRYWIKNQKGIYAPSSQIHYEYFRDHFWKNQIQKRKDLKCAINPVIAWSQIFSTIQGSTVSHKCPQFFISEEMYIQTSKNRFLTAQEKRQVYFIFGLYRSWKVKLNKFDQTDLVNHLLRKILKNSYLGPTINCLFIDQVQDLTPATVYLVSQITSNNIFYAGDTAQSISKGVTFKFSDIRLMFKNGESTQCIDKQEPEIKQLTVNFRSHNSILRVANCLIKIIEILFPKTIDVLRKQTSNLNGPKPILITSQSQIDLLLITNKKQQRFSSKQAIIVRTQQKKLQVQQLYEGAIVLTIGECKGLEYDDVVLWDLLEDAKCEGLWKILEAIIVGKAQHRHTKQKKEENEDTHKDKEKKEKQKEKEKEMEEKQCEGQLKIKNQQNINQQHRKQPNSTSKRLQSQKLLLQSLQQGSKLDQIQHLLTPSLHLKQYNIANYYQLCSQLKLLYTAVTRSKQVLLLYNSLPGRLLSLWQELELIQIFDVKCVGEIKEQREKRKMVRNGLLEDREDQDDQWRKAGIQFFKKENYKQAWTCFNNIGDTKACRMIEAKILQREANRKEESLNIYQNTQQHQPQQVKRREKQIKQLYLRSATIYQSVSQYEQAGRLYFLIGEFRHSLHCFGQVNMFEQMASCHEELKQYIQAAEMYEKSQMYVRMLECLCQDRKYILGLIKMIQHCEYFKKDFQERKEYFKRAIIGNIEDQLVEKLRKIQAREKQRRMNNSSQGLIYNSKAFYKGNFSSLPLSRPQQRPAVNISLMMQQQQHNSYNNSKIIDSFMKLRDLPLEQLKIALYFDHNVSQEEESIGTYLRSPLNIRNMVEELQKYGHVELCLILCGVFEQYQNFEDFFAVSLFEKHSNYLQTLNPKTKKQRAEQSKLQISSQSKLFIKQQLQRLNFSHLNYIQSTANSRVVNDLVRNLILCGFYASCDIFFENRAYFYERFMDEDMFSFEMKKRVPVRHGLGNQRMVESGTQCEDLSYMRIEGWHRKLKDKEIVYCLQILYQIYEREHSNKTYERKGSGRNVVLNSQEYGNAWRKINKIVKKLEHRAWEIDSKLNDLEDAQEAIEEIIGGYANHQDNMQQELKVILDRKSKMEEKLTKLSQLNVKIQQEMHRQIKRQERRLKIANEQKTRIKPVIGDPHHQATLNQQNKNKKKKNNKNNKKNQKNKNKNKNQQKAQQLENKVQGDKKLQENEQQKQNDEEENQQNKIIEHQDERKQQESNKQACQIKKQMVLPQQNIKIQQTQQVETSKLSNEQQSQQQKVQLKEEIKANEIQEKNAENTAQSRNIQKVEIQKANIQKEEDLTMDEEVAHALSKQKLIEQYQSDQQDKTNFNNQQKRKKKNNKNNKQNNNKNNKYIQKIIYKQKEQTSSLTQKKLKKLQKQTTKEIEYIHQQIVYTSKQISELQKKIKQIQQLKEKRETEIQDIKESRVHIRKIKQKIMCRIEDYQKDKMYFNKFMEREKNIKWAHLYLGKLQLEDLSQFLSNFYYGSSFRNSEIEKILSFSADECNQIKICEVVTLALSLLAKKDEMFNNFDEFTEANDAIYKGARQQGEAIEDLDEKIQLHLHMDKIKLFFAKLVYILENYETNEKFCDIVLGFFSCRTFTGDSNFPFLNSLAIMKSEMEQKLSLFRNAQEQNSYFDHHKQFVVTDFQKMNNMIAKFIRKSYQNVFCCELQQLPPLQESNIRNYVSARKQKIQDAKEKEAERYQRAQNTKLASYEQSVLLQNKILMKEKLDAKKQQSYEKKISRLNILQHYEDEQMLKAIVKSLESTVSYLEESQILESSQVGDPESQIEEFIARRKKEKVEREELNKQRQAQYVNKEKEIAIQIQKNQKNMLKIVQRIYFSRNGNQMKEQIEQIKQEKFMLLKEFKKLKVNQIEHKKLKQSLLKIEQEHKKFRQQIWEQKRDDIKYEWDYKFKLYTSNKQRKIEKETYQSIIQEVEEILQQKEREKKRQEMMRKIREQNERIRRQAEERLRKQREEEQRRRIQLQKERERKQREQEEKRKEKECSICMGELINLTLSCKHEFHYKCIVNHLKTGANKNCPLCRDSILRQDHAVGICQQCNTKKVRFHLKDYYMTKDSLFCSTCEMQSKEKQRVGNLYAYFMKRNIGDGQQ